MSGNQIQTQIGGNNPRRGWDIKRKNNYEQHNVVNVTNTSNRHQIQQVNMDRENQNRFRVSGQYSNPNPAPYGVPRTNINMPVQGSQMAYIEGHQPFSFYPGIPMANTIPGGMINSQQVIHNAQGVPHVMVPVPIPMPQMNFPAMSAQGSTPSEMPRRKESEDLDYFLRKDSDRYVTRSRSRSPGRRRSRSYDSTSSSSRSNRPGRRQDSPRRGYRQNYRYSRSPSRRSPSPKRRSRSKSRRSPSPKRRSHSPLRSRRSRYSRSPVTSYRRRSRSRGRSRERNQESHHHPRSSSQYSQSRHSRHSQDYRQSERASGSKYISISPEKIIDTYEESRNRDKEIHNFEEKQYDENFDKFQNVLDSRDDIERYDRDDKYIDIDNRSDRNIDELEYDKQTVEQDSFHYNRDERRVDKEETYLELYDKETTYSRSYANKPKETRAEFLKRYEEKRRKTEPRREKEILEGLARNESDKRDLVIYSNVHRNICDRKGFKPQKNREVLTGSELQSLSKERHMRKYGVEAQHTNVDRVEERDRDERQYDKRRCSPVSFKDDSSSGNKYRRFNSPDNRSIGGTTSSNTEMKIHISDRGRWIETNQDLSPVSGNEIGSIENRKSDTAKLMEDGYEVSQGDTSVKRNVVKLMEDGVEVDRIVKTTAVKLIEDGVEIYENDRDRNTKNTKTNTVRLIEDGVEVTLENKNNTRTMLNDRVTISNVSHQSSREREIDDEDLENIEDFVVISDADSAAEGNLEDIKMHAGNLSPVSEASPENQWPSKQVNLNKNTIDSSHIRIQVPYVCRFYNRDGCNNRCQALHVCWQNTTGICRHGTKCYKSHSFFSGQPFEKLCIVNPGLDFSKVTHDLIVQKILRQKEDRKNVVERRKRALVGSPVSSEHSSSPEPSIHGSDRECKPLIVPLVCHVHSRGGCQNTNCQELHICFFFILGKCKFGKTCTKGHSVFSGQPYERLRKENENLELTRATYKQISNMLQKQTCASASFTQFIKLEITDIDKTIISKNPLHVNVKKEVPIVDLGFDARNYTKDIVEEIQKHVTIKIENENVDESECKNVDEGKEAKNNAIKKTIKEEKKEIIKSEQDKDAKETNVDNENKSLNKTEISKSAELVDEIEDPLSPVSVENIENWDKYDRYERISEGDMSDNDLESVSSNNSNDNLNSRFSHPLAGKVAVPIGMNDPLVFNKPGSKPLPNLQGHLGVPPLQPLFPIMPEHADTSQLPPPTLLQQVIQSLPSSQLQQALIQPPKQQFHLPTDNNPRVRRGISNVSSEVLSSNTSERNSPEITHGVDEVLREMNSPELKEPIKNVWKFPHKGLLTMNVIDFVTETEAYKEEFIAEIVKILLTIELSYVTMKKLMNVVKEKIAISLKTPLDMRKILEMYPEHFQIIEMVDSDDDDADVGVKKSIQIKAKLNLGFCEKHGYLPFADGKCDCKSLHICKFYFFSGCPNQTCKFGHKLKTDHNINAIISHKLHRLSGAQIIAYMRDIDNRTVQTLPGICRFYNRDAGCYKSDSTETYEICHNLHMCFFKVKGKCGFGENCNKSHNIRDVQPLTLLQYYGLDPDEYGDAKVSSLLTEKVFEIERQKAIKNAPYQATKQEMPASVQLSGDSKSNTYLVTPAKQKGSISSYGKKKGKQSKGSPDKFHNPNMPVICRFYNNELGCKKKDWGSDGFCFFLHICQFYVTGDCKFGDSCKRSHDLASGQASLLLHRYGIDTKEMESAEILTILNTTTGIPVEKPKTVQMDEMNESPTHEIIAKQNSKNSSQSDFRSCNVEDVIKLIMDRNQVEPEIAQGNKDSGCKLQTEQTGLRSELVKVEKDLN